MEAYRNALNADGTTMVLSPDSDFFSYLRDINGGNAVDNDSATEEIAKAVSDSAAGAAETNDAAPAGDTPANASPADASGSETNAPAGSQQ